MSTKTTVRDVAELAGVGTSTVSRFVRGVKIRPGAAKRIESAIAQLGYFPDVSARALRSGRTNTIGVVIPKVSNVFFSHSVQWITREAKDRGLSVVLFTHEDSREQQARHLVTLTRYKVDGIILTGVPGTTLAEVRSLIGERPVVGYDSLISSRMDAVLLNNRTCAGLATQHLLNHGYRRILCVTGRPEVYSYRERVTGYSETMAAASRESQVLTGTDSGEIRRELVQILSARRKPNALLALSDIHALNVLAACDQLGLATEDRPPMLAFDDFDFAPHLSPPLTVLRQPIAEMVKAALELLLRRVDGLGQKRPRVSLHAGELVIRASCGCPANLG